MRISDWSSDVCSSDLHAAYLKGLLKPFKGKGALEDWANQCFALRDDMIGLAQRRVLPQTSGYPFHLLDVELAQQNTGAGPTFLRLRQHDSSAMGVALWPALVAIAATPVPTLDDLHPFAPPRILSNRPNQPFPHPRRKPRQ